MLDAISFAGVGRSSGFGDFSFYFANHRFSFEDMHFTHSGDFGGMEDVVHLALEHGLMHLVDLPRMLLDFGKLASKATVGACLFLPLLAAFSDCFIPTFLYLFFVAAR